MNSPHSTAARPIPLTQAVAEQAESNKSALGHEDTYAEHRARLTREIVERAPASGRGRLCLLGSGNANDVDLEVLVTRFAEVHLCDIDVDAVIRAIARVPPPGCAQLVAQAPLDVSGMFNRLELWSREPPAPETLGPLARAAAAHVARSLPGPFDVVVSCGLLTQLQLVLLQVVGDANPRFAELRETFNRAHMRTLGGLLAPGGVALMVTDLTTNQIYPPLDHLDAGADLAKVMGDLIAAGHVIHAAHPGLLSAEMRRDPQLKQEFDVRFPIGPWLWRNGPKQLLLVYALEIRRRASPESA